MLTSKEIIKKTKEQKESANLSDYEYATKHFSWGDIEKELASFAHHKLNAAYIAVDVNAQNFRKNKIALYYEGEQGIKEQYTFAQISELSNQFANVLHNYDIKKGERVFIFLPRIPELFISFLGILKVGAIAGTLFAAFQEEALFDRLENSEASLLITNAELFQRVEKIWKKLPHLKKIMIVERGAFEFPHHEHILFFHKELKKAVKEFMAKPMEKDDPSFMLYTSGTTGKPKGVVHKHEAIIQEYATAKWVLDLKEDDVYWCTADPGWVTGIAYEILGTWANGASVITFDGRFNTDRWYTILQDYKVTVWYTAPTAIRMLMSEGSEKVKKYNLSSLRHMASVGEPLNPEALLWGIKAFSLPFHDNWWQTELGAICIANYPSMDIKVGSMGKPIPGVV
ncbi:MAG: AMP-binding protein, partial [Candidatus Levybacteria bacterium]|nr:AMP-binding protein [Candidatus Levybacteria bacterium]